MGTGDGSQVFDDLCKLGVLADISWVRQTIKMEAFTRIYMVLQLTRLPV